MAFIVYFQLNICERMEDPATDKRHLTMAYLTDEGTDTAPDWYRPGNKKPEYWEELLGGMDGLADGISKALSRFSYKPSADHTSGHMKGDTILTGLLGRADLGSDAYHD
jgi:hypothetical protein